MQRSYPEDRDMQTRDGNFPGRRRFLKQAIAIGGTGVLVVLAAGEDSADQAQPAVKQTATTSSPQGYRLTDHIRTYYDTARS